MTATVSIAPHQLAARVQETRTRGSQTVAPITTPALFGHRRPDGPAHCDRALRRRPDPRLGGLRLVAAYEPIFIAYVTATFAMQALPTVLASYRERGILRRLDTTPVGERRVLGAQLLVNLGVAVTATIGILTVGRPAFGVAFPKQFAGFALTLCWLPRRCSPSGC